MEYMSFHVQCFMNVSTWTRYSSFSSRRILLATHLREPISRQVSEFWYRGAGFWLGRGTAHEWGLWLANGGADWDPCYYTEKVEASKDHKLACKTYREQKKLMRYGEGVYFANYYTRMLSGACNSTCTDALRSEPANTCSANRSRIFTVEDMEKAKQVLRMFDWVIITEHFVKENTRLAMQRDMEKRLDVPRWTFSGVELGWKRRNHIPVGGAADRWQRQAPNIRAVSGGSDNRQVPASIMETLLRENSLDIEIYRFAVERAERAENPRL